MCAHLQYPCIAKKYTCTFTGIDYVIHCIDVKLSIIFFFKLIPVLTVFTVVNIKTDMI